MPVEVEKYAAVDAKLKQKQTPAGPFETSSLTATA